ncbi:spermatogenesis-associated protein 31E1-like [Elephas maximus indicus]|uniref:spermatogenesis-associated protein 31E1-like n=1 Tax=Elephas maximus indicus TaxID=99487 RepID=UPI002116618A|nr:spermatogenesis-associated protein 31E1-like [Elephas maximus indicus]
MRGGAGGVRARGGAGCALQANRLGYALVLSSAASWESHGTRAAFISGKVENPLVRLEKERLRKPGGGGGGGGGVRSSVQSPRQVLRPRCPPPLPPRHLASTASAQPPEHPADLETEGSSDWITEDSSDRTTDDSASFDGKTTPESFSVNTYYSAPSVPTVTGPDGSSCPVSACSWWWAAAKAFLAWKHCESQQEHTSCHPSKASFWGGRTDGSIEAGSPSLLNPDVQKPLETEIANRVESKICKEKEKDGSFKKHVSPDYRLNSSGILKSLSHEQATTVPQPYWSKPEQLSSHQQLIYPQALGEHLPPSLHSESLGATAWVSGSSPPVQSPVLVNRISSASPVQVSSHCSQPSPHPEAQPQAPPLVPVLTQIPLQSFSPIPPLKSWGALPSVAKGSQGAFSPLSPNLPQDDRASEAHKSDSILSGDVPSRTELQKQLEQHIRKRITQHKRSESSKDVKKMGCTHEESCCTRAPGNFQLGKDLGKGLGQVPKYDISQGSENSPVKALWACSEKELRSNTGNYILRNPDKKQLETPLNVHFGRELEHITKVSGTTQEHHSGVFIPHSKHRAGPEAHPKRFCVRHKWDLSVQAGKPMNLSLSETQSLPLSQYEFPSSATHESLTSSGAEAAKFWGENLQAVWGEKMTVKKSDPTLGSPLLTPSPVGEEVQGALRQTPCDNDPRPLEAAQSGQEGRQPFQPLTPSIVGRGPVSRTVPGAQRGSLEPNSSQSVTKKGPREESVSCALGGPSPSVARLEISYESQSSRDQETRKAKVAKGSSAPQLQGTDILRTSVLAKSQNISVDLTSKSPSPPGMPGQEPGKTHLKAQVLNEEELKMELETVSRSQVCSTDALPQDCATETILRGCATDILASQPSRSSPKHANRDIAAQEVVSELMEARGSSLGQQDPKIPKLQDPWKNQRKISAPTDERKVFRRCKPKEPEEGLAGLGASRARGMSQPARDKRAVEPLGITSPQLPAEKGHAPPEGHIKGRMRNFLQSICPDKKDKGWGDPLQNAKPTSASAQSHGPVKSKLVFMDGEAPEFQALVKAVSQILEEKLRLQQPSYASKLEQRTEKTQENQDPVGRQPSYHKAPSYPENRREMSDTARNKWTHEGHRNPYTMVKFQASDQALPSMGPVPPVSPCQHGPRM